MRRLSAWFVACALVFCTQGAVAYVTELIQNGGLENWSGGAPVSWDMTNRDAAGAVNTSPAYTISENTSDIRPGTSGTKALQCDRTSFGTDYTYRYFLFSNTIQPVATATIANYSGWQKGPNCRSYMSVSVDAGVTWTVFNAPGEFPAPFGGVTAPTNWTNVTAALSAMDVTSRIYKIAFHSFSDVSLVDDVSLMGDNGLPPPLSILSMNPDPKLMLTRTVTLTATPGGGSGTYNQVAFDVGNDGSVEATDTTAPFTYDWNTQTSVPDQGTIDIKVTVTDSTLATGFTVFTYAVDNRYAGRQEMLTNPSFESWQTVNPNLPVDWLEFQTNPNNTYGSSTDVPAGGGATSLFTNFAAFDNATRFTLRYVGKQNSGGVWQNQQVAYWGKGSSSAIEFLKSVDGVTWEDSGFLAAAAGLSTWSYGIGVVQPAIALFNEWSSISTVNLEGQAFYDAVSWMGTFIPGGEVQDWNMF